MTLEEVILMDEFLRNESRWLVIGGYTNDIFDCFEEVVEYFGILLEVLME